MVAQPADYPWSSYACNAEGKHQARIRLHRAWLHLGPDDDSRRAAYRELVRLGVSEEEANDLALLTRQQKPWGRERFRRESEALTGRAIEVRPRGRPANPVAF